METGPTFDADVNEEQSLINESVQKMNSFDKAEDYVDYVNEKLQEYLLRNQIVQHLRAPPPSSSSSSKKPGPGRNDPYTSHRHSRSKA